MLLENSDRVWFVVNVIMGWDIAVLVYQNKKATNTNITITIIEMISIQYLFTLKKSLKRQKKTISLKLKKKVRGLFDLVVTLLNIYEISQLIAKYRIVLIPILKLI